MDKLDKLKMLVGSFILAFLFLGSVSFILYFTGYMVFQAFNYLYNLGILAETITGLVILAVFILIWMMYYNELKEDFRK